MPFFPLVHLGSRLQQEQSDLSIKVQCGVGYNNNIILAKSNTGHHKPVMIKGLMPAVVTNFICSD